MSNMLKNLFQSYRGDGGTASVSHYNRLEQCTYCRTDRRAVKPDKPYCSNFCRRALKHDEKQRAAMRAQGLTQAQIDATTLKTPHERALDFFGTAP